MKTQLLGPRLPDARWRAEPSHVPAAESGELACWDLDGLAKEAELHSRRIDGHSAAMAVDYWRLGRVLERARGNFKRGTWEAWLADRQVSPDRASDSRALARAFAAPDEFSGMSVENAVRAARAKLGKTTSPLTDAKLRRQLNRVRKSLQEALPKVGAAPRRVALRRLLESLVDDAQRLRRAYEEAGAP